MTDYSKIMISSDLDAFKNSGAIQTAALTFNGTLGAGAEMDRQTTLTLAEAPDFYEILFDSSTKHSGKYKPMRTSPYTMVFESTNGSELGVDLTVIVSGNTITIKGALFNPYSVAVALQTTQLNFRYIPYESTI